MKRNLFLLILATAMLASSCTPKVKVVEKPIFEQILTRDIDISRIEISDSATLVMVDVTYYPNYWITFSKTNLKYGAMFIFSNVFCMDLLHHTFD